MLWQVEQKTRSKVCWNCGSELVTKLIITHKTPLSLPHETFSFGWSSRPEDCSRYKVNGALICLRLNREENQSNGGGGGDPEIPGSIFRTKNF